MRPFRRLGLPDWLVVVFAACWSPALVLLVLALSPVYAAAVFASNGFNLLRAASFHPRRAVRLSREVVHHIAFIITRLPRMASILWYYIFVAPRDGVLKSVPFAERVQANSSGLPESPRKSSSSESSSTFRDDFGVGRSSVKTSYLVADVYYHTAAHAAATSRSHTPPVDPPLAFDSPASPSSSGSIASADGSRSSSPQSPAPASAALAPVIVFVYGGAWGSGKRWYHAHLAAQLRSTTGAVVVVPDYGYYPAGDMSSMVADIHSAVLWTRESVSRFGGDGSNITIVGHSAGAHLVALYLTRLALASAHVDPEKIFTEDQLENDRRLGREEPIPLLTVTPTIAFGNPTPPSVDLTQLFDALVRERRAGGLRQPHVGTSAWRRSLSGPAFGLVRQAVLLSGVYDLVDHFDFESRRVVEKVSTMRPASSGDWSLHSPARLLAAITNPFERQSVVAALPTITVLHAEHDATVSVEQSRHFAMLLGRVDFVDNCGTSASSGVLKGVDHSSIVIGPRYRRCKCRGGGCACEGDRQPPHPTVSVVAAIMASGAKKRSFLGDSAAA